MSGAGAKTVHATALIVGAQGVLIRGASGAGKSSLALALIAAAQARGMFARLVCDDRVRLARAGDRVIAAPAPHIAGLVERRGIGIDAIEHESRAAISLVVDLGQAPERLPETSHIVVDVLGASLPRMALGARHVDDPAKVLAVLARIGGDVAGASPDSLTRNPRH